MGVRFFTLQMIPWCFQLMGNSHNVSRVQLQPDKKPRAVGPIKLVKSDGLVKIYHQPIHVSDLMLQFPKHLVCRSDSFYIGQKIPALSEHDQLQLGHKYFLLPKHLFQSVLSFVTIASFASSQQPQFSRDSKNAFLRKAANCEPFDIQKSPSGCLKIRVSDEFISQLLEEGKLNEEEAVKDDEPKSRVCTTPQLQKDYTQLVGSRQWKPRLEPIRETREAKRRVLSTYSFGMRRSKKKPQQPNSLKASQKSTTPSKAKIKIKSSRK